LSEILIDKLNEALRDKAAGQTDRDQYKSERDELQTQCDQLRGSLAAAQAEKDRLTREN